MNNHKFSILHFYHQYNLDTKYNLNQTLGSKDNINKKKRVFVSSRCLNESRMDGPKVESIALRQLQSREHSVSVRHSGKPLVPINILWRAFVFGNQELTRSYHWALSTVLPGAMVKTHHISRSSATKVEIKLSIFHSQSSRTFCVYEKCKYGPNRISNCPI